MSVRDLSVLVRQKILRSLINTRDSKRLEANREITVLEVSPDIIFKNTTSEIDKDIATELSKRLINSLKKNTSISPYNGEEPEDIKFSRKTFYIQKGNRLLLIGPSYKAIQTRISIASKARGLINTEIGADKLNDKEGEEKYRTRLDIGHTAGFGSEERNTIAGLRILEAFTVGLGADASETKYFKSYIRKLEKAHFEYKARYVKQSLANEVKGKFSFIYTVPQSRTINLALANVEQAIMSKLMRDLADAKGSKSVNELIEEQLEKKFLGKKSKKYKSDSSVVGSVKSKKLGINKANISLRLRDTKGRFTSLISLQSLMNMRLHDQVRKNMGKGRAKQILNYRTGRFAESARIISMQQRDEKVVAFYTYMRYPYDTFAPGGKQFKPGRDPNRIIGKSIRQLATELVHGKFKVYPKLGETR